MTLTVERPAATARVAIAEPEPRWPLYAVLFSSISIVVGLIWDISWHRTIGRDSFWSPPHVLEQLAAVVAGLSCGWLVLRTTFRGTPDERARSVRFWGFRGPLGAWVCIWGTLMMITSAPFDDWWHNAYGLDVRIVSPPHLVLAWGMIAIQVGAMLMALAMQNRASPADARKLGVLHACSAGILLSMHATVIMEYAGFGNQMRGSQFYFVTAIGMPAILIATARASRLRWPATITATFYTSLILLLIWTLESFAATPKLAPIYNPVTHMVPPPFPLLLIVPAVLIDVLLRRLRIGDWRLAAGAGITFVLVMVGVHWFWSAFLLSPAARNHFFGVDHWNYFFRMSEWRYQYWNLDRGADGSPSFLRFIFGLGIASVMAMISARIGLWWGNGMSRVQR